MDNGSLMCLQGVWASKHCKGGDMVRHYQLVWRVSLGGGGPLFLLCPNNGTFEKDTVSPRDKACSDYGEGRSETGNACDLSLLTTIDGC